MPPRDDDRFRERDRTCCRRYGAARGAAFLLLLAAGAVIAGPAQAQVAGERHQTLELGPYETGKRYKLPFGVQNVKCKDPQSFLFNLEGDTIQYVRLAHRVETGVKLGELRETEAWIDLAGVPPGTYSDGRVIVDCTTCGGRVCKDGKVAAGVCCQDRDVFHLVLTVVAPPDDGQPTGGAPGVATTTSAPGGTVARPCSKTTKECDELRRRAEAAEEEARRARSRARQADNEQPRFDDDAANLDEEAARDREQAERHRQDADEYRDLAQAAGGDAIAARREREAAENDAAADELEARAKAMDARADELSGRAKQANEDADRRDQEARDARRAYEECLVRLATACAQAQQAQADAGGDTQTRPPGGSQPAAGAPGTQTRPPGSGGTRARPPGGGTQPPSDPGDLPAEQEIPGKPLPSQDSKVCQWVTHKLKLGESLKLVQRRRGRFNDDIEALEIEEITHPRSKTDKIGFKYHCLKPGSVVLYFRVVKERQEEEYRMRIFCKE